MSITKKYRLLNFSF